jgi:adenylate kinase
MRVVVTGQVGMDKAEFLRRVVEIAREAGRDVKLYNVGERMYAEAPDVPSGRILDLPLSRLNALRRSVFKDILSEVGRGGDFVVNTHATFRWRHGLFYAFDYDHMTTLQADLYITLVDNIDRVHQRLLRDGHTDHSLKDIMVWREEEIMATELLAHIVRGHGRFYILSRGEDDSDAEVLVRLMYEPHLKKVYLSFPMTHVTDPETLSEIDRFRTEMKRRFICFDPGDVEEKHLCSLAVSAAEAGKRTVELPGESEPVQVDTAELLAIVPDIDGQIYSRDFKLIDQADMIISFIPELPSGKPGLSSGVERELQHAYETTKEVYVIWQPKAEPSPFITETATEVFGSTVEALEHFRGRGYIQEVQKPLFEPGAGPRERGRFG